MSDTTQSDSMQIALPLLKNGDLSNNGWTPTPVSGTLRGGGSVTAGAAPPGASFVVRLDPLAWPKKGARHLTVSLARSGPDDVAVTVALLQGGGVVAARRALPPAYKEANFDLTDPEVEAISDYSKLSVVVTLGEVVVSCCTDAVPAALHAWLSGAGCNGAALLTWDGVSRWKGDMALPGGNLHIEVYCDTDNKFYADLSGCHQTTHGLLGPCNSPLNLSSGIFLISAACCPGIRQVQLTVTP